jgi:hypothetical protein
MTLTNGLVVMTPSSISYSGTSASINADGSVDFSAVTSLSLNGVFTGDYDNYMVVTRSVHSSDQRAILSQLRASGTNAGGSDYTLQVIYAASTTVSAQRYTSFSSLVFGATSQTQRSGDVCYVFGPFLAQPTASRTVNVNGDASGAILSYASTHSLSTSYDGFTLSVSSGNFSGLVTVFGFNQ